MVFNSNICTMCLWEMTTTQISCLIYFNTVSTWYMHYALTDNFIMRWFSSSEKNASIFIHIQSYILSLNTLQKKKRNDMPISSSNKIPLWIIKMSIFWAFSKQAARRIKLKQEKISQNSYYWSIHKSLILTCVMVDACIKQMQLHCKKQFKKILQSKINI